MLFTALAAREGSRDSQRCDIGSTIGALAPIQGNSHPSLFWPHFPGPGVNPGQLQVGGKGILNLCLALAARGSPGGGLALRRGSPATWPLALCTGTKGSWAVSLRFALALWTLPCGPCSRNRVAGHTVGEPPPRAALSSSGRCTCHLPVRRGKLTDLKSAGNTTTVSRGCGKPAWPEEKG